MLLDPGDLGPQLSRVAGPDVRLEHQAHPRRVGPHRLDGTLDDVHDLIPLALDGREHGRGFVWQPGFPDHPDSVGDRSADAVRLAAERADAERDEHARTLPGTHW